MNRLKQYVMIFVLLAAVLLCALLLPGREAQAASSGTCGAEGDGSNLTWTLDDAGTLTISGTGTMKDYYYYIHSYLPWGTSIKSVMIESGVTSIGNSAFYECSSLTSVTIPDSVTSIGAGAFYGCSSLTSVTIPDSVTSIGNFAFSGCSSLTSVTIPDGVTSIGDQAFSFCSSLTEVLVAENNPSFCSKDGVLLTKDLKRLILCHAGKSGEYRLPDSVEQVDEYAFSGSKITKPTLGRGMDTIPANAFSGMYSLKELVIGKNVSMVLANAFGYCRNLKDVYYEGTEAEWDEVLIAPGGNDYLLKATVHFNTVIPPEPGEPDTPLPGDLSGDGLLDVSDAAALFAVICDPAAEKDPAVMDLNGDGRVNNRDALLLFRRTAGQK